MLSLGVDTPAQNLSMFPSLTETSLLIALSGCTNQTAACPAPTPTMWTSSSGHSGYLWMDSNSWEASSWETSVTEPLQLQGEGMYIHETIHMSNEPRTNIVTMIDEAVSLTSDLTINYPGGTKYNPDVGFYSLYGGSTNQSWTATNGTTVNFYRQLPGVYYANNIPSISYGMHLGSATYGINGSLVLGGYDRARCLTDPITSNSTTFNLVDIGLGVQEGGSAFANLQNGSVTGLLGSEVTDYGLSVITNPGVPYLYLPQSTCDSIAKYLPVSYDSSLGLYLWNTTDPAFEDIVSSPHVLSFQFASSTSVTNDTIHVPFALLNLTLQNPLVDTDTQYFPCSPYSPSDGSTYHLGRAFLQGAFLGQNWQSTTTWLAQAPGPDHSPQATFTVVPSDTSLAAMPNAPGWYKTWGSILTPLAADTNVTSPTPSATASAGGDSGLSGGAIAGIVIGVLASVAVVAAAVFFIWRRRVRAAGQEEIKEYPLADQKSPTHESTGFPAGVSEVQNHEIHELGGGGVAPKEGLWKEGGLGAEKPFEVDGQSPISELPGNHIR